MHPPEKHKRRRYSDPSESPQDQLEANKLFQEYTQLAPTYDARWRVYIAASLQMTVDVLRALPGSGVLDVACGTGQLLEILQRQPNRRNLVGIDAVPAMLDVAKRRVGEKVTFVEGDASTLPFADNEFQLVVSTNALHYFTQADRALQEMRRVLAVDGHVVITDWCRNYFWMKFLNRILPRTRHAHVHVYTEQELATSLHKAGFRVIATTRRKIDWFWGLMTVHAVANRA